MSSIRLRLICTTPPTEGQADEETEFGLQDRKQMLFSGQKQGDGSIHYEFGVEARPDPQTAKPRFSSAFVHGSSATPFLYLSLKRKQAAESPWIRRLKIPLASITWAQVEQVARMESGILEARVAGTGTGTVPLLGEGWTAHEK
ncbi:MAG TPA: DUF5990 family protein [Ardenticatenaceae bacterium]|nr:DUF5990 family protein [Ardenticatenaceae bacterium]